MFQYGALRSVEEKKKRLGEEIHKQRVLLEIYEQETIKSQQQQAGGEEADAEERERLGELLRLQGELNQLKGELEALRLRGAEVWIVHQGLRKLLEITASSQLVFARVSTSPSPEVPSDVTDPTHIRISALPSDDPAAAPSFEIRVAERVREIYDIRSFRPLAWNNPASGSPSPPHSSPSPASSISRFFSGSNSSTALGSSNPTSSSSSSSLLPRTFELTWRDGKRDCFVTQEGAELEALVEAHLRRFKSRFQERVQGVRIRCLDARCSYDSRNDYHEQLLLGLWTAVFPDEPLDDRVSSQWKQLGFQGTDPATDFRGMGLLGLRNLHYLCSTRTAAVRRILEAKKEYPFAVTGINITHMMFQMLGVSPNSGDVEKPLSSWWSPLLVFFCSTGSELAFEETYVQFFLLFDAVWTAHRAGYMDFPRMIALTKSRFELILARKLHHLDELENQVNQEIISLADSSPPPRSLSPSTSPSPTPTLFNSASPSPSSFSDEVVPALPLAPGMPESSSQNELLEMIDLDSELVSG